MLRCVIFDFEPSGYSYLREVRPVLGFFSVWRHGDSNVGCWPVSEVRNTTCAEDPTEWLRIVDLTRFYGDPRGRVTPPFVPNFSTSRFQWAGLTSPVLSRVVTGGPHSGFGTRRRSASCSRCLSLIRKVCPIISYILLSISISLLILCSVTCKLFWKSEGFVGLTLV